MLVIFLDFIIGLCYFRVWLEGFVILYFILLCRVFFFIKRKDRFDEKFKDRFKDKGVIKELSEKDRGRDKIRKRRSVLSGSSSIRWGRGNYVFFYCEVF